MTTDHTIAQQLVDSGGLTPADAATSNWRHVLWNCVGRGDARVQKAAFDHLHEPLVEAVSLGGSYACGWICAPTPIGAGLNHGGSNRNSFALIWVVPDWDFAAVVCTNTGEPQAYPACAETMDHLMMAHSAAEAIKDPGKATPDRLEGRYQLLPTFIFDVRNEDGRLLVGITNQPTQEVFADSPTKWSYKAGHATLEFLLRSQGPAYALILHQNGRAQPATMGVHNERHGSANDPHIASMVQMPNHWEAIRVYTSGDNYSRSRSLNPQWVISISGNALRRDRTPASVTFVSLSRTERRLFRRQY